jgi:hypothetical protein
VQFRPLQQVVLVSVVALRLVAVAGLWRVWHIISAGALVWCAGDNGEKVDARSRIPG